MPARAWARVPREWAARVVGNKRTVLATYPGLRMGNVLYFALHAWLQQARGIDYVVVDPEPTNTWASAFDGMNDLLVSPELVRRTDRREHIPPSFLQGFGTDFTRSELEGFIRSVLPNAEMQLVGTASAPSAHDVTVNVRRGDYYTNPTFRTLFGFDIVDYVRRALAELDEQSGWAPKVRVISDDPLWCRENLAWLGDDGRQVSWSEPADSVLRNFYDIAAARRLIITNSTFSYWAAYVSNVVYSNNHNLVWAPTLHSRAVNGGQPWQHDPRWRKVEVFNS